MSVAAAMMHCIAGLALLNSCVTDTQTLAKVEHGLLQATVAGAMFQRTNRSHRYHEEIRVSYVSNQAELSIQN
jgi:hypothetical protein